MSKGSPPLCTIFRHAHRSRDRSPRGVVQTVVYADMAGYSRLGLQSSPPYAHCHPDPTEPCGDGPEVAEVKSACPLWSQETRCPRARQECISPGLGGSSPAHSSVWTSECPTVAAMTIWGPPVDSLPGISISRGRSTDYGPTSVGAFYYGGQRD